MWRVEAHAGQTWLAQRSTAQQHADPHASAPDALRHLCKAAHEAVGQFCKAALALQLGLRLPPPHLPGRAGTRAAPA